MPELKNLPDTKVRELKAGDMTIYGRFVSQDAKVKWSIVTFEGKAGNYEMRLHRDDVIGVSREVPTEEEKAAERREAVIWSLDMSDQRAHATLQSERIAFASALNAGKNPSSSSVESLYKVEAEVALWDRVAIVHKRAAAGESGQFSEPITRIEAVKHVSDRVRERLLEQYRPTSRSTSVVANAFEDIVAQAKMDWLKDLQWKLVGL
jgi:hypothetical protein